MIYWSKMAELNTRKRLFPTLGKPFLQQFHEYYFDFDEENEQLVTSEASKRGLVVLKSIKSNHENEKNQFRSLFRSFIARSRFDLCYEKEIRLENSPIHLVPVSQPEQILSHQEIFIGFRGMEEGKKRKENTFKSMSTRIIQIMDSLHGIQSSSSKNMGLSLEEFREHLLKWFLGLLFEQTEDRLPLFGWVRRSSIIDKDPETLFSDSQKYLARRLMYSGSMHQNMANTISAQLYRVWYDEIAPKLQISQPNRSSLNIYAYELRKRCENPMIQMSRVFKSQIGLIQMIQFNEIYNGWNK
jgi:hypothetical protein